MHYTEPMTFSSLMNCRHMLLQLYNTYNVRYCIYIDRLPMLFKGIVHLNIIFSYMKVNKICNLDQPVY